MHWKNRAAVYGDYKVYGAQCKYNQNMYVWKYLKSLVLLAMGNTEVGTIQTEPTEIPIERKIFHGNMFRKHSFTCCFCITRKEALK